MAESLKCAKRGCKELERERKFQEGIEKKVKEICG